jgi:hypothetical protein
MRKALWFSRHQPTSAQLAEIKNIWEYELLFNMADAAKIELNTEEAVMEWVRELETHIAQLGVEAVFGVFPTPILSYCFETRNRRGKWVSLIAAWNVQRSIEGGKPTFEHKEFQIVAIFNAGV